MAASSSASLWWPPSPWSLLVGASSSIRTLAEFIDQVRRKQQSLNYATTGKGRGVCRAAQVFFDEMRLLFGEI